MHTCTIRSCIREFAFCLSFKKVGNITTVQKYRHDILKGNVYNFNKGWCKGTHNSGSYIKNIRQCGHFLSPVVHFYRSRFMVSWCQNVSIMSLTNLAKRNRGEINCVSVWEIIISITSIKYTSKYLKTTTLFLRYFIFHRDSLFPFKS